MKKEDIEIGETYLVDFAGAMLKRRQKGVAMSVDEYGDVELSMGLGRKDCYSCHWLSRA